MIFYICFYLLINSQAEKFRGYKRVTQELNDLKRLGHTFRQGQIVKAMGK